MPNLREWLEEFIELYHSEPCLWKVKAKEYHERGKKDAAYEKLLVKLREIEPSSDKDSVLRKINNIRCAYKKEQKKVTESIKSGSGTDDRYEPKLWYYPLLRFLDEPITPLSSRSNLDDKIQSQESSLAEDNSSVQDSARQEEHGEEGSNASARHDQDTTPTTEATSSPSPSLSRKRNSEAALTKDVLLSVRNHFKRPAPSPPPMRSDDRFDIFGKAIAFKLRDLNKTQRILAEKIINETLAAAELGTLTTSHTVTAPISPYSNQQSPIMIQSPISNRSIHNTSPYSNQQSPIMIQSPISNRSIHNTSPYSNQQSPIIIQSPISNRSIHNTSPHSNQQSPIMIQSPISNRSIHNTSPHSNQQSPIMIQSPISNRSIHNSLPYSNQQSLLRNHSQPQTPSVVLLSIPENPEITDPEILDSANLEILDNANPEILDNATYIDNDVPNQQHTNSAADYLSNYIDSSY